MHPESILGKQVSILFVERKNTPLSFIFVSVGQIPVYDVVTLAKVPKKIGKFIV